MPHSAHAVALTTLRKFIHPGSAPHVSSREPGKYASALASRYMKASVPNVLKVKNLVRCFESSDRSFTLRVPDFRVKAGSVNIVIGRSGCGKSTLLDMLGLISYATEAEEFCIRNEQERWVDIQQASRTELEALRRHRIGYILQTGGLLSFLTVMENIKLPLQLTDKRHKNIAELMECLGISSLKNTYPAKLSTGQRQRVAIARALAASPNIILADEPTGALDPITAVSVRDLLLRCAVEQGAAVLIVTHDAELFRTSADHVYGFDIQERGNTVVSTLKREGGKA